MRWVDKPLHKSVTICYFCCWKLRVFNNQKKKEKNSTDPTVPLFSTVPSINGRFQFRNPPPPPLCFGRHEAPGVLRVDARAGHEVHGARVLDLRARDHRGVDAAVGLEVPVRSEVPVSDLTGDW